MGSSCRYIGVMVSIVRRDIGWGIGGGIRTIFLSSLLLSVRDIRRVTTVDVGGTSGMVHVPVSVGSSYRHIGVMVSIVRRDIGWGIGGGIRTVFLSSLLLSVRYISRVTTIDVGGTSGIVHVPVSMGSSCRYIGVMVSIERRDIGWGIGGGIRTVFLSGLLLSVRDISRLATVDVGGTSSIVDIPVSVGRSYRYIGVRVSIDIGRSISWGIRTIFLSDLLFSVRDISRWT